MRRVEEPIFGFPSPLGGWGKALAPVEATARLRYDMPNLELTEVHGLSIDTSTLAGESGPSKLQPGISRRRLRMAVRIRLIHSMFRYEERVCRNVLRLVLRFF